MIANDFQKITELLRALFTFDGDELKVKTTGVAQNFNHKFGIVSATFKPRVVNFY